jgi:hypothetical protein
MDDSRLLKKRADVIRQGIGIDCGAAHHCRWHMLASQEADTIITLRTLLVKTELIADRDLAKVELFSHGCFICGQRYKIKTK